MNLSKRQFLKVGLGGAAGLMMSRLLKPAAVLAKPVVVPADYLESDVHHYWMKLSHNDGQESRLVRRKVGAILRNLADSHGRAPGFASRFDGGVVELYRRWQLTSRKPGSLFELVQLLYEEHLYPALGETGGHYLFGTLLAMTRGRDGGPAGESAHESYLRYRQALLQHKRIRFQTQDPDIIRAARKVRTSALRAWQGDLVNLIDLYSRQELRLNPNFRVQSDLLEGIDLLVDPRPRLRIVGRPGGVIVYWTGRARLQYAPNVTGPWFNSDQLSPATFPTKGERLFFRAVRN